MPEAIRWTGPPAVPRPEQAACTISGGANLGILMDTMVEWRNTTSLTPYVGGTLGWSDAPTSATLGSNEGTQSSSLNPPSLNTLAWGGVLGLDWAFTQRLSTSLSYRYLNRADAGASTDSNTGDTDQVSHDVLLFPELPLLKPSGPRSRAL